MGPARCQPRHCRSSRQNNLYDKQIGHHPHNSLHCSPAQSRSDHGACSVAASYKPPMLVTRVRLPACALLTANLCPHVHRCVAANSFILVADVPAKTPRLLVCLQCRSSLAERIEFVCKRRMSTNDTCGVRTHALSEWRLEPPP